VSREHAIIEREPDGFYLRDLESLNGTYVNRTRVTRQRLADGDEVQVGKFKLTFFAAGE
jgi:pSer/pThr/pTyr-binding forkhead associated (FHA) protein